MGKTCRYCNKLNHFAKDCYLRKERGHAIPLADIEEGLFDDDYFTQADHPNQSSQDAVEEIYSSKN